MKKLLAGILALALCSTNMPLQTIFAEEFTSGNPDVVSEEIPEIFTNSIRVLVSYMPSNLLPKKQSKKVFHLYRYKKTEKLSPENQIFSKKFESCRNSSQKRKIRLYYCIESPSDSQDSGYLNLFFRFAEIKVTTIFHSHVYLIQYAFG